MKKAREGILPKGTLLWISNPNNIKTAFILPAGPRTIHVFKTGSVTVDLPELLITFASPNNINVCVVSKDKLFTPALKNFHHGGMLCIGNVPVPEFDNQTPSQIRDNILRTIFDGAFSDDLNPKGFTMDEFKAILKKTKGEKINLSREDFFKRCSEIKNATVENVIERIIKLGNDE